MKKLQSFANWKTIVPLFVLFMVFSFVVFPYYAEQRPEVFVEKPKSLDARFLGYDFEDVHIFFDYLGEEGRRTYHFVETRIDMAYPLIYGLLFMFCILWLTKNWLNSRWLNLAYIPIIAAILDVYENMQIARLLRLYPDFIAEQVNLACNLTRLKCLAIFVSVALIIVLLIIWLLRRERSAAALLASDVLVDN